jgi:hypothetical protein
MFLFQDCDVTWRWTASQYSDSRIIEVATTRRDTQTRSCRHPNLHNHTHTHTHTHTRARARIITSSMRNIINVFFNKFLNKFTPNCNNWCFYLILFHKTSARSHNIQRHSHWITRSNDWLTWCDNPAADWQFCSWYTHSGKTTMNFSLCSRLQETRQIIFAMAIQPCSQNHYHFARPVGAQFHWTGLKYFVWHNNLKLSTVCSNTTKFFTLQHVPLILCLFLSFARV